MFCFFPYSYFVSIQSSGKYRTKKILYSDLLGRCFSFCLYTDKPDSAAKFPNPTPTAPKKTTKKNAIPIQRENIKIENPERFYEFDDEIGRFVSSLQVEQQKSYFY